MIAWSNDAFASLTLLPTLVAAFFAATGRLFLRFGNTDAAPMQGPLGPAAWTPWVLGGLGLQLDDTLIDEGWLATGSNRAILHPIGNVISRQFFGFHCSLRSPTGLARRAN